MTSAAFADLLLRAFGTDTWFATAGAELALRRIGWPGTAEAFLAAARRVGWIEYHPTIPENFCVPACCWLPIQRKTLPQQNG